MNRPLKDKVLNPFGSVSFDTSVAYHNLSAKSNWLTFYTAAKFVAAILTAVVLFSNTISWALRSDGDYWEPQITQIFMTGVVLIVFLALEKSIFWGFRAYLDAHNRITKLEATIRETRQGPIYVPLRNAEVLVPATRDRYLGLMFVLSKYFVFLIYTAAIGFFIFTLIIDSLVTNEMLVMSILMGPIMIFFMGRWILKSEKEIRLSFAKNSAIESEMEVLTLRNIELEKQLTGFTGEEMEKDGVWQERLDAKAGELAAIKVSLKEKDIQSSNDREEIDKLLKAVTEGNSKIAKLQKLGEQHSASYKELETHYQTSSERLENLVSEFGKNSSVPEVFAALKETLGRKEGIGNLDVEGLTLLSEFMRDIREKSPDGFENAKALSFVSAEELRINQYDAIVRLYSNKIQKLRASDMDEEEQLDAIDAMRRLRDREISELEGAS